MDELNRRKDTDKERICELENRSDLSNDLNSELENMRSQKGGGISLQCAHSEALRSRKEETFLPEWSAHILAKPRDRSAVV